MGSLARFLKTPAVSKEPNGTTSPAAAAATSNAGSAQPHGKAEEIVSLSPEVAASQIRESTAPAESREQAAERIRQMVDDIKERVTGVEFDIDSENNEIIVRVIKKESGDVVRQIPPEEILRLHSNLSDLRGLLLSEAS
jgi:flagellar protein FlaG